MLVTLDAYVIQLAIGAVVVIYVIIASLGWRYEGGRPAA